MSIFNRKPIEARFSHNKIMEGGSTAKIYEPRVAGAIKTEAELKLELMEALQDDFHINSEVSGKSLICGSAVRIDFIIRPKQHLIDIGFNDVSIGIEVKSPTLSKSMSNTKKLLLCVMQANAYMNSKFGEDTLDFILIYPGPELFYEARKEYWAAYVASGKSILAQDESVLNSEKNMLGRMMEKLRIGYLEINENKYSSYSLRFHSGTYFNRAKDGSTDLNTSRINTRKLGFRKY